MPRTIRTNAVKVETVGELTKGELRRFLDECEHAGIDDSAEVFVQPDHQGTGSLVARADFGTGAVPGYGYPTADPDTERLVAPLKAGDRAAYEIDGRLVPGTVDEVTGGVVRWTSDAPEGHRPITAVGPRSDFTRLGLGDDPPARPSIGGLQP